MMKIYFKLLAHKIILLFQPGWSASSYPFLPTVA